ncbi:MAG: lipid-binding SYLF domain-containing protein [Burkholderiales bacterium]|nr:lipid-binding SYLF domain-containing protein [Burkholderiales bacterium]
MTISAAERITAFLRALILAIAGAMSLAVTPVPVAAQDYGLEGEARYALSRLMASHPSARMLDQRAYATLVFPDITKAGFLVGGEYGNGVLFRRGGVAGYYNIAGASYGLQAGAQSFGYALFFMNEGAWRALHSRDGLQVGVGPSIVILDEGKARSLTSATLTSDVYAFVFGQQGLMAGAGLEGTKITRLNY